jgi:hypothetical protein
MISGSVISTNTANIDVTLTSSGTIRRVGTREMTATIRGLAGVATGVAVDIYLPAGMTMTSRYGYGIYT